MKVPNRILFAEVKERIAAGSSVTIAARGASMRPFIREGDRVLLAPCDSWRPGDILLFEPAEGTYILHRLIKVNSDGSLVMRGDGNFCSRELCAPSQVIAKAVSITRSNGKTTSCGSGLFRLGSRLWRFVRYPGLKIICKADSLRKKLESFRIKNQ